MPAHPQAHLVSLTSLLNRRAELFDAARPTAASVDRGNCHRLLRGTEKYRSCKHLVVNLGINLEARRYLPAHRRCLVAESLFINKYYKSQCACEKERRSSEYIVGQNLKFIVCTHYLVYKQL
jgi:hypothetical protein